MSDKITQTTSCTQKVIYLKNGVKQGNPNLNAKRCGAKAKSTGLPCKGMAIKGKARCRLHGGKSTGAKTEIGLEKCRKINLTHGYYSITAKQERFFLKRFLIQHWQNLKQIFKY